MQKTKRVLFTDTDFRRLIMFGYGLRLRGSYVPFEHKITSKGPF